MLLIITLLLLSIALVILTIKIGMTDSCLDVTVSSVTILSIIATLVASIAAVEIRGDNKAFLEEYKYVESVINDGEYYDPVFYEKFGEKVIEVNTKIAHERNRKTGFWTWNGVFHSKEIAELPYLRIPSYTEEE